MNIVDATNALHYSECHYHEFRVLFIVMLSAVTLIVIMLSVMAAYDTVLAVVILSDAIKPIMRTVVTPCSITPR